MSLHIIDLFENKEIPQPLPLVTTYGAAQAMTECVRVALLNGENVSYAIVDDDQRVLRIVTVSSFIVEE